MKVKVTAQQLVVRTMQKDGTFILEAEEVKEECDCVKDISGDCSTCFPKQKEELEGHMCGVECQKSHIYEQPIELPSKVEEAIHAKSIAGVLPKIEEDRRTINQIIKYLKARE